jgi:hypothetical protein
VDAELTGCVRTRRYNAPLVRTTSNCKWFTFERRIKYLFHRAKKCIQVKVEDLANHRQIIQ